mgnify:CR=1 FL=1
MNLLDNFQRYIRRNELAAPEDFIPVSYTHLTLPTT